MYNAANHSGLGYISSNNWDFFEGDMPSLIKTAAIMAVVLFGGFFCVVAWKMMTGEISLSYLLDSDVRDANDPSGFSTQSSPGRAQTLLVTLVVAGYYLLQTIQNPREFPEVPTWMVGILGGSQALYLGGKLQALLPERWEDLFK
jgi:hypothetical protein